MNLPRFLVGMLLGSTLALMGCQENQKELASQQDTGLPTETATFAATGDGLPSVTIVSPENYTYSYVTVEDPTADVTVQFDVANTAYPSSTKGVVFILDRVFDPTFPEQALAIVQTDDVNPVLLSDIPAGQHTLTACLVAPAAMPGGGTYWQYLDRDPVATGIQRACGNVILRVSITDCWPTVYSAAQGKYICDPAHPGACCIDDNPCSVDNCQQTALPAGGSRFECRFGPVAECCQSDYECAEPSLCYRLDKDSPLDDGLLNKCYECDYLSATADDACNDQNLCTVDDCASTFMCEHSPIVGPQGEPCCMTDADCDDTDPCTIDKCENVNNGQGYCAFHSYKELSDDAILAYGRDPASFDGCCAPGKELEYCTDHLIVIDSQLKQDACWNVACVSNQCRYGKGPDPLCCNTAYECNDCAQYDSSTGECVKDNLCTADYCIDNHCTFQWDPFHPDTEDCCQHNNDCNDNDPNENGIVDAGEHPETLDWCSSYLCYHETDPLYCDLEVSPPTDCPEPPTCVTYTCDQAARHCKAKGIPDCCVDNADCDDSDYCTSDVCDPLLHTCSHADIPLVGGKKCCNTSVDCYDNKVCTTEACVAHQCRYGAVTVNQSECASGKCCNSSTDLNGNGSADDCEVAGSCTPYMCANHCCVPKTNLSSGVCITSLDCEDGDPYTWNVCVGCTCALNPPTVCDEAHPTCNDQNPCTVDSCDFAEKRCKYVAKPNCCTQQADCVPDTPDACTNYQCIKSLNICQNSYVPDCCTSDDDVKCNDFDDCTQDLCVNGKCRHVAFDTECCNTPADCADGSDCTADLCTDHKCEHTLLETAPDGAQCCATDGACADTDQCTQDMCVNHKCANPAIPDCCYPEGQEAPMCADGNPCTADWCVFGKCRHLGPQEAPATSHIPDTCCVDDSDCVQDDNYCTDEVCPATGQCISVPKDVCVLTLPYCQDFNQGTWPPEFLGWKRVDTNGAPEKYNWEYSAKGPLGLDYHLRFDGLKYPLDEFNAFMLSPAFDSHDQNGDLLTYVTVQWENFLDLNAPETTNLAVDILPNGNIASAVNLWNTTTTADLEASFLSKTHQVTYLGDYFRVGFNVNALHSVGGVQIYGGASHITGWDIDTVCFCAGNAPRWVDPVSLYGVFLDDSQHFPLKATDADPNDSVEFRLIGAPDFVSIVPGGYDWQTKKFVADLVVSPTDPAQLGEWTFTVQVTDGCLFTDQEVTVSVFLRGGYLVWAPEGVSPLHAQRIADAIAAQPDQGTAARQWQVIANLAAYPDLSVASGIFACLGIKGANYQLVEERNAAEEDGSLCAPTDDACRAAALETRVRRDAKEALVASLAHYLEGGGRLYIEGGDAWYDDPPTLLADYMKVEATSGGVARVDGPVAGGNFLHTLGPWAYNQLPYNSASPDNFWNSFNDRLKVAEHTVGKVFLENAGGTSFATAIGYCDDLVCSDNTNAYRTIASSLAFGGMENGTSTRVDLMGKYLYFFEHGYPNCASVADCDDGQACTTDTCSGTPKRCANVEIPNCEYCVDDLDCDTAFPTLDYACNANEVCNPLPGYMRQTSDPQAILDRFVPGFGWTSPVATSTITFGGAGSEDWEQRNVSQVAAKLRILHDYVGEIEVTLSHGTTSITAKLSDLTQTGDSYYFTTSEAWGRPAAVGSTTDFKGAAIEGDWTLTVTDTKPTNYRGGKLVTWWLFVAPDDVDCTGNPALCSDGNACTVDACLGGFCKNSLLSCADIDPLTGQPNLCTTDSCDPATGCVYTQKLCDDGNDCSLDLCDTRTGDCYHEWPAECWNPCTQHSDCGHLQYCKEGHCENIPGYVYDAPVTGSEPVVDDGVAQIYPLNIPSGSDKDSLGLAVDDRTIDKLRVKVMVTHENVSDLEIKLVRGANEYVLHPQGAGVGSGQHWVFSSDDETSFDVPSTNLDVGPTGLVGADIVGDWQLSIQDKVLGNSGTIDGWVLFMVQRHCASNADCDDHSKCTQDLCVANTTGDAKELINLPKVCSNASAVECDDGLWCNGTEFCHPDTGCIDGQPPLVDDGIPCTDDICDELNDEVYHLANPAYCNDNNACTTDVCDGDDADGVSGCQHVNNTDACDDGIYCTTNDKCGAGECVGTPTNALPGCSCNDATGCKNIFNDNRCAGSYMCNVAAHTCVIDPTTEVDCTKVPGYVNEPCAKHQCDPQDGECKVAFIPQGVACEDGDLCTQNDMCNAAGQCLGVEHVCDDQYWCNGVEVCDPVTGACSAPDAVDADGKLGCDPLDPNGCFRPGFNDHVDCTIDVCDGEKEEIFHYADDTFCDNGLFCDGVELCNPVQGCVDGPDPHCEDYNPCTVNKCDETVQACDFHDHVQHCSWPCDGDHTYDAGDDDCGYDDACVGGAGATAGTCQPVLCGASCYTARATSPNAAELALPVPDNDDQGCLEQSLTVALPANLRFVERVEAKVDIAHTSIVDLRVALTDPDGYTVKLWENVGGSRDDFSNTFDQSWPDTFRPVCGFRGDEPSGTWRLKVCDVLPEAQGTLQNWTLYVTGSETDTNIGDRCDNAMALVPESGTVLAPNEWTQSIVGSTTCAQEDHIASCGGGGKERVYRFHLSDHKLLNATVNTGGRNWVLYVKGADPTGTDCTDGTLSCAAAPTGGAATITDLKLAPGDYFFFVDSNGDYGDYAVDITFKTLLDNGGTCDHVNDCISAYCVDATCCNVACDGLCEACDGLDTANGPTDRGTCTYIADGKDPEDECFGNDKICGKTCFYKDDAGTIVGGECKTPDTSTPHIEWDGDTIIFGGRCQRCDGAGGVENVPHGLDPFGQCDNRSCDGARVFYEERCSDTVHPDYLGRTGIPGREGTCDCYDEKYGVFGCQGEAPHVSNDWCPGGYMCDPTDGDAGASDPNLLPDGLPDDCRSSCTAQAHCQYDGPPAGWYCEERLANDNPKNGDDGTPLPGYHECKQRKDLGLTCNDTIPGSFEYGECILNGADPYPCVDGVCCNTTCTALCMRCDGVDTLNSPSEDIGTCTYAASGKDPDVECRTDDTTNCGIGWCDGVGLCDWWDPDTTCVGQGDNYVHGPTCGTDNNYDDLLPPASCTANGTYCGWCQPDGSHCDDAPDWVFFAPDTCSGEGHCLDAGGAAQKYADCPGGMMCDCQGGSACNFPEQAVCLNMCLTDADCARPFPTDCDGDGGVNYYCRDYACNPTACNTWMDATTNGSQATPSASFGNVHYSLGGSPEGPGTCTGTCGSSATGSNLGFYPQTRAVETPLQYRN